MEIFFQVEICIQTSINVEVLDTLYQQDVTMNSTVTVAVQK